MCWSATRAHTRRLRSPRAPRSRRRAGPRRRSQLEALLLGGWLTQLGLVVQTDAPHALQIPPRVALKGHQRGGPGDGGHRGEPGRYDLRHLLVLPDPDDGHEIVLAGDGVDLGHLWQLEERLSRLG